MEENLTKSNNDGLSRSLQERIQNLKESLISIGNLEQLENDLKRVSTKPEPEDLEYKNTVKKSKEVLNNRLFEEPHKASVIGDTIGDPLKDTSGPSLNILIKLSSIISVVFGSLFVNTAFLVKN